ncbi:hypothetical protein AA0242T_3219 [Acetobacter aceti NRIC 0242]|uniref:Uncharacterized protein n=1 Tax=Acetobacter aceti NBRC 14818 TaxID=887700 RepID=A0AB33ILP0_ACEAC|nr:hypothetical protein [Acetobacter aceti]TCS32659.1 hypothetical protein EDC15_11142 [Acetobacter aceti NBRC 14818]BCK77446.1 hypothetical protein EMQ_3052 [Acetobacter aceti NBRC 14818]GAN57798.1 hypothetical protein Abac_020_035 [Acetobacter aceti NBRC 14818]GBO82517.1 hypothetical protein AA0242T_3219 [Acetobacter aceti NRIC 0242]
MNDSSLAIADFLIRAGKISECIEHLLAALQSKLTHLEAEVCPELQNLDLATQLSSELADLLTRSSHDENVVAAGHLKDPAAILRSLKLDAVSTILSGETLRQQPESSEVELF